MIRSISKTIRSWKHLVRVCLNTTELDTAVYEHLMRLETLTHLTFEMTFVNDLPPHLSQAVLPRNPFPKLKDLTLDAYHPPLIVEWLNYFHFECLSSLSCTFGSIPPLLASQIADLINAITTQPCHKSLEKVDIMLNHDIMNVEIGLIRPLFSFTHLRYVDIFRICVLALSDDDLYDLAASWPLLENLSLNVSNVADSLPTFKGFFHLLRRCPHLEQLYINIDMRDTECVDVVRFYGEVRNHVMRRLSLGNSLINDAKHVASILWVTLPSLKQVDLTVWHRDPIRGVPERDPLLDRWQKVNDYLGELRDRGVDVAR